ncbi:hypothetical protein GC089_14110 [Cellulomonas sp. JZ18]|uniref:hypothetical protein n=1 Tax=Cellulomonas sp. JZ18 TaxID=2654191 RepID=UPI0012D407C4|nr:hypothetical protein [Cellulomonas sp. JZ18]QGQ20134.1 hypothetical protein GC089_14110 [Cellulomonas sp. JZ18]
MSVLDAGVARDVADYAARVRSALADLEPDQVDDLTDGLEANLTDALADDGRTHHGGLADEFGPPDAYAAELRSAAGLAPAAAREGAARAAVTAPWRAVRELCRAVLVRLRSTRWFPGVEDLALALRPAWWVLRGWTVAHLLLQLTSVEPYPAFWLPSTFAGWVVLVVAVVASAQWGRGRWRAGPRGQAVLRLVSAAAAVASVVLVLWVPAAQRSDLAWMRAVIDAPLEDGVVVAGERAANLFVYDADGRPVDGAQVVDQDGRPVTTEPYGGDPWAQQQYWPDGAAGPRFHTGATGDEGEVRWNVFPLRSAPSEAFTHDDEGVWRLREDADELVAEPRWPFAAARPVTVPGASATAAPDAATDAATDADPGVEDAATAEPAPTGDAAPTPPSGTAPPAG